MFILSVEGNFSAAHQVKGYPGDCAGMHGHTYKVQARVAIKTLDNLGMAMDFRRIKSVLDTILETLDHKDLNELPYFRENNATTEHLAMYIYDEMKKQIKSMRSVTVWEGYNHSVTYDETVP
ncbi:6-carboxytetrahydropterin synthase [candidate division WOR-3 bacterium]|nr:6-carboxytetrahydropterin synthase [candidate division WOR-3 bacterium]